MILSHLLQPNENLQVSNLYGEEKDAMRIDGVLDTFLGPARETYRRGLTCVVVFSFQSFASRMQFKSLGHGQEERRDSGADS